MVRMPSKPRVFEEHQITTADNDFLYAKLMFPKPPATAKRLVFIPPLIGASASQNLIVFRNFTRRGAVLLSFEYRAHPRSTGIFDLDKTIVDTRHAMLWANDYAHAHGLPLHGFSTCYGVVPLATQFVQGQAGGMGVRRPFWSLSAVSGLFSMDRIIRFDDFAPLFARNLGVELDRKTFLRGIEENAYDWEGDAFRDALLEFLKGLFPQLRIGRDYFEELVYDRVDIPHTLKQLLEARYLQGVHVPSEIPCNFFYGCNDDVLSIDTPQGRESYCRDALAMIPHAVLHEREIDHYGQGPDHDAVIEQLSDLFEESESRAVPLEIHDVTARNGKEVESEDIHRDVRQ